MGIYFMFHDPTSKPIDLFIKTYLISWHNRFVGCKAIETDTFVIDSSQTNLVYRY